MERVGNYQTTVEADPLGVNVGVEDPFIEPEPAEFTPEPEVPRLVAFPSSECSMSNINCMRCVLDLQEFDCERALALEQSGAVGVRPRTTVWGYGRWNFVRLNHSTGQYGYWRTRMWSGTGTPVYDEEIGEYRDVLTSHTTNTWVPLGSAGARKYDFFSHGWRRQKETPLQLIEVALLYKYAEDLLKNSPNCKEFFEAVLKKLEANTRRPLKSTNLKELFGLVYGQGGFVRGTPRTGSGAARGTVGTNNAQIMLAYGEHALPAPTPQGIMSMAIIVIHELTHVATSQGGQPYYDADAARASWEAASDLGYNLRGKNPYPVRKENESYDDWVGRNSNFFTGMLQSVCSGVLKK